MAKIKFSLIQINEGRDGREIIFPYDKDWYALDWEKVPDRFKELYVLYLRLQGLEIPDYLKAFQKDSLQVKNLDIQIDLDVCRKISEMYPISL